MSLETIDMTVNPFVEKQKGRLPELTDGIKIEHDPAIEQVLEKYKNMDLKKVWHRQLHSLYQLELEVLNPVQIDTVLQKVIDCEEKKLDDITGVFLSRLIQYSYDAGYNNFVLTTGDVLINYLCYHIKGSANKKLEVSVKGNVGDLCGAYFKQGMILIEGNGGNNCGSLSTSSTFLVERNLGKWYGSESNSGSFFAKGDVGEWCGCQSKYGVFTLEGVVGDNCGGGSYRSKYYISDPEAYQQVKAMTSKRNEVILRK